ncbi:YqjF family protein [Neobacillus kokaensis]|uniref:DUF2071 domain-containing protein n=1 Tax=Neobacillus kokaensis TaxID=2759023 RepID=A0ABQ3N1R5_9BACI|nr:DUF2071 domain-containing protein [Neobacillus kokaensis]GHH97512.1 hypothetical protein AM1BK_10550 [Neobacillus kokaensis]
MGWILKQTWEDLLFCHWEAAAERLQELLPAELELDLFDGKAWLTMLPFGVSHQRFRFLPEIPLLNRYLELNVRTYVKVGNTSGVYFFTLDANHLPSVLGARAASLPYCLARMSFLKKAHKSVFYSKRVFGDGEFSVKYAAAGGPCIRTEPGTLDFWLLERYSLFTKLGPFLLKGNISHESMKVSEAEVDVATNLGTPFGLSKEPQLVHFCPRKEAFIFPLKMVRR